MSLKWEKGQEFGDTSGQEFSEMNVFLQWDKAGILGDVTGQEFGNVMGQGQEFRNVTFVGFGDNYHSHSIPSLFSFPDSFHDFLSRIPKDYEEPAEPSDPIPTLFPHGLGSPDHAGLCPWRFFQPIQTPGNSLGLDSSSGQECSRPCPSFHTISHLDFCSTDSKTFQRLLFPGRECAGGRNWGFAAI